MTMAAMALVKSSAVLDSDGIHMLTIRRQRIQRRSVGNV